MEPWVGEASLELAMLCHAVPRHTRNELHRESGTGRGLQHPRSKSTNLLTPHLPTWPIVFVGLKSEWKRQRSWEEDSFMSGRGNVGDGEPGTGRKAGEDSSEKAGGDKLEEERGGINRHERYERKWLRRRLKGNNGEENIQGEKGTEQRGCGEGEKDDF
ncbi:hypothetical protein PAMP_002196 [Pampus punctatissimus]